MLSSAHVSLPPKRAPRIAARCAQIRAVGLLRHHPERMTNVDVEPVNADSAVAHDAESPGSDAR
jgi:hypothetical protein